MNRKPVRKLFAAPAGTLAEIVEVERGKVGGYDTIFWDVQTGKLITTFDGGYSTLLDRHVLSPDGKRWAIQYTDSNIVHVSANDGVLTGTAIESPYGSDDKLKPYFFMAFTADSAALVYGTPKTIFRRRFDKKEAESFNLDSGNAFTQYVCYIPKADQFVITSAPRTDRFEVRDATGKRVGEPIQLSGGAYVVNKFAASADGSTFVCSYEDNTKDGTPSVTEVYDVSGWKRKVILPPEDRPGYRQVMEIKLSSSGRYLATRVNVSPPGVNGYVIDLWTTDGKRVASFHHPLPGPSDFEFLPDEKTLVIADKSGQILQFDTSTGQEKK